MRQHIFTLLVAAICVPVVGGIPHAAAFGGVLERPVVVRAAAMTKPVTEIGDVADDPAIWIDHADPARSLIIGTNKDSGLLVYDLNGDLVQRLDVGRLNNVAVIQPTPPRSGEPARVFASNRSDDTIAVFSMGSDRRLSPEPSETLPTGMEEVYGLCAYLDGQSGHGVVVVVSKLGQVREFEFRSGKTALLKREFWVGGQAEGVVADVEHGWLHIGEETLGIWRYPLASKGPKPPARLLVDVVGGVASSAETGSMAPGRLAADVEGLAIYDAGEGRGWLIASCQGEDRFAVYDRATLAYRGSFSVRFDSPLGPDPVTHTDGIEATSTPLGARFPRGVFIAQDHQDHQGQNFKIVDWREIEVALNLGKETEKR